MQTTSLTSAKHSASAALRRWPLRTSERSYRCVCIALLFSEGLSLETMHNIIVAETIIN